MKDQTYFKKNNTANSTWICAPHHPCKRSDCPYCYEVRRKYIFGTGIFLVEALPDLCHVTISWSSQSLNWWQGLKKRNLAVSHRLSVEKFFYISVIAFGESCFTPHTHMVTTSRRFNRLAEIFHRIDRASTVSAPQQIATASLFTYLFDKNLYQSLSDQTRPRGMRVISGSRGLCLGFPNHEVYQRYVRHKVITISTDLEQRLLISYPRLKLLEGQYYVTPASLFHNRIENENQGVCRD